MEREPGTHFPELVRTLSHQQSLVAKQTQWEFLWKHAPQPQAAVARAASSSSLSVAAAVRAQRTFVLTTALSNLSQTFPYDCYSSSD